MLLNQIIHLFLLTFARSPTHINTTFSHNLHSFRKNTLPILILRVINHLLSHIFKRVLNLSWTIENDFFHLQPYSFSIVGWIWILSYDYWGYYFSEFNVSLKIWLRLQRLARCGVLWLVLTIPPKKKEVFLSKFI